MLGEVRRFDAELCGRECRTGVKAGALLVDRLGRDKVDMSILLETKTNVLDCSGRVGRHMRFIVWCSVVCGIMGCGAIG